MYEMKRAFRIANAIERNVAFYFANKRNRADFIRINSRLWSMTERINLRSVVADILANRANVEIDEIANKFTASLES